MFSWETDTTGGRTHHSRPLHEPTEHTARARAREMHTEKTYRYGQHTQTMMLESFGEGFEV